MKRITSEPFSVTLKYCIPISTVWVIFVRGIFKCIRYVKITVFKVLIIYIS